MPPMSRPLMTAWTTVSTIGFPPGSGLEQGRARIFLREDAGEIAVLPLHADGTAMDVLAVGPELHLAAGRHRGKAGRDVERRQGFAHLLRFGRSGAFQRVGDHVGLRYEAAGIFKQEVAGALLVFG